MTRINALSTAASDFDGTEFLAIDNNAWGETRKITASNLFASGAGQIIIDVSNAEALLVRKDSDGGDVFVVDTSNSRVGVGPVAPAEALEIEDANATTTVQISNTAADGDPTLAFALSGTKTFTMGVDDSDSDKFMIGTTAITTNTILTIDSNQDVGVGITSPSAQLHVDQSSATGSQPVLYLDQADVSEEMIRFETTIGTGNAIEALGGKSLTTTHFIKVTIPGASTRYFPVGTIA